MHSPKDLATDSLLTSKNGAIIACDLDKHVRRLYQEVCAFMVRQDIDCAWMAVNKCKASPCSSELRVQGCSVNDYRILCAFCEGSLHWMSRAYAMSRA